MTQWHVCLKTETEGDCPNSTILNNYFILFLLIVTRYIVTIKCCHNDTLSQWHFVPMTHCHNHLCHNDTLSQWHVVTMTHLKYFFTYCHNKTSFNPDKWEKFNALVYFDRNIDSFQISCHCDISVNCPFYAIFDTFWNIFTYGHNETSFNPEKWKKIQSFGAFWLKYWIISNFVSLWHISKLSILCIFWHFLKYVFTYSHK